ncbi:sensor histidine kinase [Clostridium chauvoei]|uniref:sensor histidine kinase n=1 Tax=Clostridium chauvoei TaxID=46867 RepID=UPI00207949BF|nr:sensor histidine kinase [Clostridium chauvoei]
MKKDNSYFAINLIIDKVISEINDGKNNIFKIVDNLRDEFQNKKQELDEIKIQIDEIIREVDELEQIDRGMRRLLAKTSRNFKNGAEELVRDIYEETLDIRVKYITKQNKEKELRKQRDDLEQVLKNYLKNIEDADNVVNKMNVALGYLQGKVQKDIKNFQGDSQLLLGIKILENQENERKRIAREIHDGPAQYLANSLMRIDFCKKVVEKDLSKGLEELDDLKANVKKALKEVRGILFDLRPLALEDQGLYEAIEEMVRNISNDTNINIEVDGIPNNVYIDNIIQIAIYRLIQEILTNIEKHSQANNVIIKFSCEKDHIIFMIRDDGVGFNVEETLGFIKENGTSYGLIGILDRVNQLQGGIEIKSTNKIGTTYIIKLPTNRGAQRNDRE